jgi:hypothetical protein
MKKTLPAAACRVLGNGQPEITITTEAVDRMSDRVIQAGLTFPEVVPVLFGHDMHSLPVGVSGRASMLRGAKQTRARWTWIEGDAQASAVRNVYEQGGLAASVGMLVRASEPNGFGGRDITRAEVVEFSLVTVPANAECTRLLKSLGWDDVVIEIEDEIDINPGDVLAAVKQVVPALLGAEVARRRDLIDLDEIDNAFDPVACEIDRAALVDALRIAIPGLVKQSINKLRGGSTDGPRGAGGGAVSGSGELDDVPPAAARRGPGRGRGARHDRVLRTPGCGGADERGGLARARADRAPPGRAVRGRRRPAARAGARAGRRADDPRRRARVGDGSLIMAKLKTEETPHAPRAVNIDPASGSVPALEAAPAALRAEQTDCMQRAGGTREYLTTRRETTQIVTQTGRVESREIDTPVVERELFGPLERLQARRRLPDLADQISLAEEAVERAKQEAAAAGRAQRKRAIEAGEAVVRRELPALIAELRTAQQHMVAFAERMAVSDAPVESRYFQDAVWVFLLPGEALDAWIGHVARMFKIERPG